jgi:nucleoside-diphosphate-sugar epimerase
MSIKKEVDIEGTHVVFGATGAYGYSVSRQLIENGYKVKVIARDAGKAAALLPENVEIAEADVMKEDKISMVCKGASVLYLGHNFPYSQWKNHYIKSILNILEGCKGTRPLVVFPGNVYGYGKFQRLPVDESHPLNARSEKGILRNQIEAILWDYHFKGKIKLIIPRFADFYGPNVINDLYGDMFRNAIMNKAVIWPVNADVEHNFTYIEDAAKATLLMVRDPKAYGKVFHVSGPTITARKFIEEIFHETGNRAVIKVVSKNLIRAVGILNSNARGLVELLYEYEDPYVIDDTQLLNAFPNFSHTHYNVGIRRTVDWFKENIMDH